MQKTAGSFAKDAPTGTGNALWGCVPVADGTTLPGEKTSIHARKGTELTSNDELKPCPFCKNASNIKLVEYRPNCSGAVVCGQCGARGPKKKNDHKRGWKEKAIEGWNTRASIAKEDLYD